MTSSTSRRASSALPRAWSVRRRPPPPPPPGPGAQLVLKFERPPVRRLGFLETPLGERQVAQPSQGGGVLRWQAGRSGSGQRLLGQGPRPDGVAGRLGHFGELFENLALALLVTFLDEQDVVTPS